MDSKWKAIWNRRRADEAALSGSWQDIFLELKRMNGFDVMEGGIPLDSLLMQAQCIKELLHLTAGMSVFDVGCGAGANLYLLQRDGIAVGGTDYSAALVEAARFSYFPDEAFAERVLTRMLEKTTGAIGLIDLHDAAKKEDFLAYRRAAIPDYDERYKGLNKLFYRRSFFANFARSHNLRIEYPAIEMEGYWNAPFVFNCFMYRE